MAKVLLINPSYRPSYGGAKASIVNPVMPTLGLATIAAMARDRGHKVEIYDLSFQPYDFMRVRDRIKTTSPDIVGITATTPLMNQLRDMSVLIKDISSQIMVVGGGPHPSALPEETLGESLLDAICIGESDYSFADICDGRPFSTIRGIWYRDEGGVVSTGMRAPIENLDELPMPAWDLYALRDYEGMSRLLCRRPPLAMAEFSRGCVFKCDFCASKITMAQGYRKKSPERCAEEVERLHRLGFREFMLADDIFTSDQEWAIAVCEAISRRAPRGIDMAWSCTNGIRVESANDRLFRTMRAAGCYRVSFGFETGNDQVLKKFGKGGRATIEQGKTAVRLARAANIDTSGFFLLGLSPDTEDSMMDTIRYAAELPLPLIKFGVTIGFPGTSMFADYAEKGLIRSYDWDDYFIYTDKPLFAHPNLDYDTIMRMMDIAYKKAILFNPGFIGRRFLRGIRTGEFFWDAYYALKFFLMPAIGEQLKTPYYARDRWPTWDYATRPPRPSRWQIVRKPALEKVA